MKKRLLAMSLAAGFTVLMTACGDETTNTDIIKAETFATEDSLPDCNKAFAGKFATVADKKQILICAQDGSSFDWLPVAASVQSATDSSSKKTEGCTAKALEDGSGVEVLCNGKSVAVVKNGAKGEQGQKGADGEDGEDGKKGSEGNLGAPGKDFKLDSTYCSAKDYGYGTIIYDCNGRIYPVNALDETSVYAEVWKATSLDSIFYDKWGGGIGEFVGVHLESAAAGTSQGKIARWEGDNAWDYAVSYGTLARNFAIGGKATLTVSQGATQYEYAEVEPLVGAALEFYGSERLFEWRGICLAYTATDSMQVVVRNSEGKIARVSLAPAADNTVADILASEFVPDSESVDLGDIMNDAEYIYVKAVGSLEAGTYENTFAIYEFGAYGQCSNEVTGLGIKAAILEAKGEATRDLVDKRGPGDSVVYKTVKIGNQVWMAENLRIPYPYLAYDGDDDPDTGDKMAYCPSDPDELAAKGCLYSWAAAMDSAARLNGKPDSVADYNVCGYALDCTVEAPVQGICPNGWHLPSKDEIDTLLSVASYGGEYEQMAFVALAGDTADGLNWLGFSADGVGYTVNYTSVTYPERFTLWASDDYDGYPNYSWTLYTDGASIIRDYWGKSSGRSVRCIKDQVEE